MLAEQKPEANPSNTKFTIRWYCSVLQDRTKVDYKYAMRLLYPIVPML